MFNNILKGKKKMSEFPMEAMHRIIKRGGAERISEDAEEELARVLEDRALEIAEEAVELAEDSGRKTVNYKDIRLAIG